MNHLLQRLSLRNLRLIRAIAESGQLSLAADKLGVTQPAASRSLGDLERLIGDPLFTRHPGGMEPTPLGDVFIRHTNTVLSQLEQALEDVNSFRNGTSGTVRVGAVTGPAVRFVVPAVQKLKSDSRNTRVSVDVAPSFELMTGIANGEYDIALCRPFAEKLLGDISVEPGRVEVLRVVARAGHPLHRRSEVGFSDLQELTWVIQRGGMPIRDAVTEAFASRGLNPPLDTVDTPSLLMALSYLENSDAVAAMTEEVADLIRSSKGPWQALPMADDLVLSPYSLVARRASLMNPICLRLHGLLRHELAQAEAAEVRSSAPASTPRPARRHGRRMQT